MKVYEYQCQGCAVPAYPCIGTACPHRSVLVYYCDKCKSPIEEGELYSVDGEDLCEECLKEMFKKEYV